MPHKWDKNLSMKNEFQDFYSSELVMGHSELTQKNIWDILV